MITLGILQANNPCALRPHPGEGWRGANGIIRLPGGAYQSFNSMAWGLRAALRNLHSYRMRHGLATVHGIISRWAPPEDNNPTETYVANVARWIGIGPHEPIPHSYQANRALLLAIARQETGGAYRPAPRDVAAAFRLMADEERARGRDPTPYLPPVTSAPLERGHAEAQRLPRRGWFGIGTLLSGAIAWFHEQLATFGVYPREAIQALRDALSDLPARPVIAAILAATALFLIFITRSGKPDNGNRPDDLRSHPDPSDTHLPRNPHTRTDAGRDSRRQWRASEDRPQPRAEPDIAGTDAGDRLAPDPAFDRAGDAHLARPDWARIVNAFGATE